jgi:CP family cyanate transporter-like MFS transporter
MKIVNKKFTWKAAMILFSIILIAANLRAPITSVGPVILEMTHQLHLTPTMVGLVTAIPLICFSLFSTFMPRVSRMVGLEKLLLFSLLLLALGLFTRSAGNILLLFSGSAIIGIAITIGNVLMPAFIKKKFPNKIGLVTGIYLVSMNLTSALAVGYSISLGKIGGLGWKGSIGIWGVLALASFFVWLPIIKKEEPAPAQPKAKTVHTMWKSRLAWQISIFMGLQSLIFYVFAAWLPAMLQSWGMDAGQAGWMLSYVQMGQVPMMLIGPLLADKMKNQTALVWFVFILLLAGLLMITVWKTEYIVAAVLLVGVSAGLAFTLAMMFFVLRTRSVSESAELSGMSQSVGYFIAACGPPIFGALYGWTNSWQLPMFLLLMAAIVLFFTGLYAAKDRYVSGIKRKA